MQLEKYLPHVPTKQHDIFFSNAIVTLEQSKNNFAIDKQIPLADKYNQITQIMFIRLYM